MKSKSPLHSDYNALPTDRGYKMAKEKKESKKEVKKDIKEDKKELRSMSKKRK